MRRLLTILCLLCWPLAASADIYWTDDFEQPDNLAKWTDYGLGYNHRITTEHTSGVQGVRVPYPNGGFLDRFTGKDDKQFNIKFSMKLGPGFKIDATGTKVWYLRADQATPGSPNGVLMMIFGNPNFAFVLQGAFDSTDTEIHYTDCVMTGNWTEYQFQWIMNDPGQANGSETAWCNGRQTYSKTGRQYKGPTQASTFVQNIRLYSQFGEGDLFIDKVQTGNRFIGDVVPPPPPVPPPIPPIPPVQKPGMVTELVVSDITKTTATVTFKVPDDGTGTPAKVEIRMGPSPMFWGSATAVCTATPCALTGLTPATAYGLQGVAYRGTQNVNAVFGPLSPVTTFTTFPEVVPPPAEQCQDFRDNDGDGKIDFPADPGCADRFDNDETDTVIPPPPSVFSNVTVNPLTLSFTYELADCQNVNRRTTGKTTKTVTLTCINDAELRKQKPHKK